MAATTTHNLGKLKMAKATFLQLAETGAKCRLVELEAERRAIVQTFPALNPAIHVGEVPVPARARKLPRKAKRGMTAAQRAEVSKRMKAYWSSKRGEKRRQAS